MSKAIYFAGVSRVAGVLKFRTAASPARFQQLGKLGDTDVEMINVCVETKSQAAKELLSRNFANGRADIEALLVAVAQDDNPFVKKARKNTVVVKVPTRFAAQLQDAQVEVSKKMTAKEAARIREEFNARVKAAYEAN
jgi:divalent metal cation (Fe/Co/Zn/Cd) transporter